MANLFQKLFYSFTSRLRRDSKSSCISNAKYSEELAFRQMILDQYLKWYKNEIPELYGVAAPKPNQKVFSHFEIHGAILTYLELVQKPKYLFDLDLHKYAMSHMRVLDVGSGPMPSALAFEHIDLFCLDPLMADYLKMGFPVHCYDNARFVHGYSENMPFDDSFFDAVISVNAIDHVDDFLITSKEIQRVLKPSGALQLHVHYHKKTPTEPIELNDDIVGSAFSWSNKFRKIKDTRHKFGTIAPDGESYALWGTF